MIYFICGQLLTRIIFIIGWTIFV